MFPIFVTIPFFIREFFLGISAMLISTQGYALRLFVHRYIPFFQTPVAIRMTICFFLLTESLALAGVASSLTDVPLDVSFVRSLIFIGSVVIITQLNQILQMMSGSNFSKYMNEGIPLTNEKKNIIE